MIAFADGLAQAQEWVMEARGQVQDGVIHGDPWTYQDGCTTALLRSGEDGPHRSLADRLCGINGRLYE